jgi:hypothetical protein
MHIESQNVIIDKRVAATAAVVGAAGARLCVSFYCVGNPGKAGSHGRHTVLQSVSSSSSERVCGTAGRNAGE